jgi:hypothetical protein
MKLKYTHTTKGVRYPYAQRVITLTSESGSMRLTTTQGELWKYEHDTFGGAGYYEQTYPVSIPDNDFGDLLKGLRDDEMLEEEYLIHE